MSSQNNTPLKEVDMTPDELLMQLTSRELLGWLLTHNGTGSKLSIRDLAEKTGCGHNTVHKLLSGESEHLSMAYALPMTIALGVDLPVLFKPTGRAVPAPRRPRLVEAVPA